MQLLFILLTLINGRNRFLKYLHKNIMLKKNAIYF